jgi:hypothetical protein
MHYRNINLDAKYLIYYEQNIGWWCSRQQTDPYGFFLRIKEKRFGAGGYGSYCKSFRHTIRVLKETVKDGSNWSFAGEHARRNYKAIVNNSYTL